MKMITNSLGVIPSYPFQKVDTDSIYAIVLEACLLALVNVD